MIAIEHMVFGEALSQTETGYKLLAHSTGLDGETVDALSRAANVGEWINRSGRGRTYRAFDVVDHDRVAYSVRVPGEKVLCHTYVVRGQDLRELGEPYLVFTADLQVTLDGSAMPLGALWNVQNYPTRIAKPLSPLMCRAGRATDLQPVIAGLVERVVAGFGADDAIRLLTETFDALISSTRAVLPQTDDGVAEDLIELAWLALPWSDRLEVSFTTHAIPSSFADYHLMNVPDRYVHELRTPPRFQQIGYGSGERVAPGAASGLFAKWLIQQPAMHREFVRNWNSLRRSWIREPERIIAFGQIQDPASDPRTPDAFERVLFGTLAGDGNVDQWAAAQVAVLAARCLSTNAAQPRAWVTVVADWLWRLSREQRTGVIGQLSGSLSPRLVTELTASLFERAEVASAAPDETVLPLLAGADLGAVLQTTLARKPLLTAVAEVPAFEPMVNRLTIAAAQARDAGALASLLPVARPTTPSLVALCDCVLDTTPESRDALDALVDFALRTPKQLETIATEVSDPPLVMASAARVLARLPGVSGDLARDALHVVTRLLQEERWSDGARLTGDNLRRIIALLIEAGGDGQIAALIRRREWRERVAVEVFQPLLRGANLTARAPETLLAVGERGDVHTVRALAERLLAETDARLTLAPEARRILRAIVARGMADAVYAALGSRDISERVPLVLRLRAEGVVDGAAAGRFEEAALQLVATGHVPSVDQVPWTALDRACPSLAGRLATEMVRRDPKGTLALLEQRSIEVAIGVCGAWPFDRLRRRARRECADALRNTALLAAPFDRFLLEHCAARCEDRT